MVISNQKIKLSSLNTHGIKGNLVYVEKPCMESDIVFISEHWLNYSEQNIIEAISSDKKIFFHSAMDDTHKSGRPFGGFCWVINTDIELVSYDFISSNISLIK
jgi:hypothetical protein